MRSLLALLIVTLASAATNAQAGGTAVAIPFEDVPGYSHYSIGTPASTVIRDAATWERLHATFYNLTTCDPECRQPPPAPVDFERQMVIIVGNGSTACMLSEPVRLIHNVERRGDVVFVWVGPLPETFGASEVPGEASQHCATAIDTLVHMVIVERLDLPVLFGGLYGYVPPPRGPFEQE